MYLNVNRCKTKVALLLVLINANSHCYISTGVRKFLKKCFVAGFDQKFGLTLKKY